MPALLPVNIRRDIMPEYLDTPIGSLLEYHNLGKNKVKYTNASLLIGMCMDNRKNLNIPENFAFIIRTGGGNLRQNEFKISFTIAIGKVKYIALIVHNNCGMVDLHSKKDDFINGLVENGGWDEEEAKEHFNSFAPVFELENEIEFVIKESNRLNIKYPRVMVAPLYYNIEDKLLYQVIEDF